MKRIFALCLCLLFVAGCTHQTPEDLAEQEKEAQKAATLQRFCTDNEIVSYEKIDPEKTVLTVVNVGSNIEPMLARFMEENPDVQIVVQDIVGGDGWEKPWVTLLEKGARPDLMIVSFQLTKTVPMEQYFEDLTANPVVSLYKTTYLDQCARDGKIYSLPSPSELTSIHYNKTLFDRYGWQEPQSFAEFLSLCDQITEDTQGAVLPWKPNAKYQGAFLSNLQGFLYGEHFAGVENRTWYNEFLKGNATYAEHMQPAYALLHQLMEHGLLTEADFSYSATQMTEEFVTGKLAMLPSSNLTVLHGDNFDFGVMPYPSTDGQAGFMIENLTYCIGKPIKEHTDAEEDALQRLLAFLSTKEAQDTYTNNSMMVSSLVDNNDETHIVDPAIQSAQKDGRIFSLMHFSPEKIPAEYASFSVIRQDILAIVKGEMSDQEAMAHFDAVHKAVLQGEENESQPVLAQAGADFTVLETSEYFADVFRETTDADLALVLHNSVYRGNLMRIFAGDMTESTVRNLLLRSLSNDSTLQRVQMTGKQVLDALNDPLRKEGDALGSVYALSGLCATVAPWKPLGERVSDVTLADGTPLDETKLYTVALWDGTVKEDYIQSVEERYEGKFIDHLRKAMVEAETIMPNQDKRMTLLWD